jgi:hypothetical protein
LKVFRLIQVLVVLHGTGSSFLAAFGAHDHLVDFGLIHGGLAGNAMGLIGPSAQVEQFATFRAEWSMQVVLYPSYRFATLRAGDFQRARSVFLGHMGLVRIKSCVSMPNRRGQGNSA